MGLLELLQLVQRCINVDAAGHDGLTLLVDIVGASRVGDGGLF
jgi:hypothetical protein